MAAGLLVGGARASAQVGVTADLGVARFSDDPLGRSGVAYAAPTVSWATRRWRATATGALARLEARTIGHSLQGAVEGRALGAGPWSLEVAATAGLLRFAAFVPAEHAAVEAFAVGRFGATQVAVGGGAGSTWLDGRGRPVRSVRARAAHEAGALTAVLDLGALRYRPLAPSLDFFLPVPPAPPASLADAQAALRWRARGVEAGVAVTGRLGQPDQRGVGAVADVALAVVAGVAVTAAAGRQLEDVLRGVGRTRFVAAGLRLSAPHLLRRAPAAALVATWRDDGALVLRGRAAGTTVEVVGDVTGWVPHAMTRDRDGRWRLELPAVGGDGSGAVQWRVDGGAWLPPPGLPVRAGDFDGLVGVLVVPARR